MINEEPTITATITNKNPLEVLGGTMQSGLARNEYRSFSSQAILLRKSQSANQKFRQKETAGNYVYYAWVQSTSDKPEFQREWELAEDKDEYIDDFLTGTSPLATVHQKIGPGSRTWRGVFSLQHKRKVLFTQKVEMKTAELPRWKPHITLDRRTRERENV